MKLFYSQIQPILLYGLDKAAFLCEKVHLFALKRFLGVTMRTPNDLVYGETNRYPIVLNSVIRCIRYWLKLTRMEEHRYPKKAYKMLRVFDERGKHNWVSNVRHILFMYGFGYVWFNNGVENISRFIYCFRQRLVDCRWQEWHTHIQNSPRFELFRIFSADHDKKLYLYLNVSRHLKCIMAKFRLGISDITVHRMRYQTALPCHMLCPMCGIQVEDEVHFVFCCPALDNNLFLRNFTEIQVVSD